MKIGKVKKGMIHNMEEAYELVYGEIADDNPKSIKDKSAWTRETANNDTIKGE